MIPKAVLDRGDYEFEGLPPAVAIYFAALEQSGCREIVESFRSEFEKEERRSGKHVPIRNLDASMAFKAYTGTMFTNGQRYPLYETRHFYASSPTDAMFGVAVKPRTLSDTNLAGRMEDLMEVDTDELVWQFSHRAREFFGLDSNDYFFDNTDVDFFGVARPDGTGKAAAMKYSTKCKSGRTEALHKEVMNVCCGDGTLVYSHIFDGATADQEMDIAALDKLLDKLDPECDVLSGDCKFCDVRIFQRIDRRGCGFVTKVPHFFSGSIRELVRMSALSGVMDESPRYKGRWYYETHDVITDSKGQSFGDKRLIAYRLPKAIKRAVKFLEQQGLKQVEKALKKVWHQRFDTREEAVSAILDALDSAEEPIYRAVVEYVQDPRALKKGGPAWMARIHGVSVDPDLITEAAERYSVEVLVTNIPFAAEDAANPRQGMTADTVINRYLQQCTIEKRFRMQKTCHGVAHIFIHTPVRQDAMILMDCLATAMQSALDAVLKRERPPGEKRITMEMLGDQLVGCRIGFDREEKRIFFSGDRESKALFFRALDRLGVDLCYAFPYA